jgi:hypothetical protein
MSMVLRAIPIGRGSLACRRLKVHALTMAVFVACGSARDVGAVPAQDAAHAESRVVSASLFKNGLALVQVEVAWPAGARTVVVDHVPHAAHGSLWIESDAGGVTARRTWVDKPVDRGQPSDNLQHELGGQRVIIRVRGEAQPLEATVIAFPPNHAPTQWDRLRNRPAVDVSLLCKRPVGSGCWIRH